MPDPIRTNQIAAWTRTVQPPRPMTITTAIEYLAHYPGEYAVEALHRAVEAEVARRVGEYTG